jgi:hypothetical protein
MGEISEIIPNGIWKVAEDVTVKTEEQIYENIPIIQMEWTEAELTVRREQYERGLVILNEIPFPENKDPITLPLVTSTKDEIDKVLIERGGEWPNGVTALFKDKEKQQD